MQRVVAGAAVELHLIDVERAEGPDHVVAAQPGDPQQFDVAVGRVGRQTELERRGHRASGGVSLHAASFD